jgi:hypothetical protein
MDGGIHSQALAPPLKGLGYDVPTIATAKKS